MGELKIGSSVAVTGTPYLTAFGGDSGGSAKNINATISYINTSASALYPYYINGVGWFDERALTVLENDINSKSVVKILSQAVSVGTMAYNLANSVGVLENAQKMKEYARRTYISLIFDNKNITEELNRYLISFGYTDNEEGMADDINLKLADPERVWLYKWLNSPKSGSKPKGHTIDVTIIQKNWDGDGKDKALHCGEFELDNPCFEGPPLTVTLKASSIKATAAIKNEKKTKAWEGYSLKSIGQEIANNAGYKYLYELSDIHQIERVEQVTQSDLPFLQKLCKDYGVALKVTDKQIVLFDQSDYEKKPVVKTISLNDSGLKSYSFSAGTADKAYKACTIKYTNPNNKKTIKVTYKSPDITEGEILEIRSKKVSNEADALKLAKKKLRDKNKGEYTCKLTLDGDVGLVSGLTVELKDFGVMDGRWIISNAEHNVTGGYEINISLRKCMTE